MKINEKIYEQTTHEKLNANLIKWHSLSMNTIGFTLAAGFIGIWHEVRDHYADPERWLVIPINIAIMLSMLFLRHKVMRSTQRSIARDSKLVDQVYELAMSEKFSNKKEQNDDIQK